MEIEYWCNDINNEFDLITLSTSTYERSVHISDGLRGNDIYNSIIKNKLSIFYWSMSSVYVYITILDFTYLPLFNANQDFGYFYYVTQVIQCIIWW